MHQSLQINVLQAENSAPALLGLMLNVYSWAMIIFLWENQLLVDIFNCCLADVSHCFLLCSEHDDFSASALCVYAACC